MTFSSVSQIASQPMEKKIPSIIILGRQNTGKSTLFNTLVGQGRNIVTSTPGTTRDLIISLLTIQDRHTCQLIDLPGFENTVLLPKKSYKNEFFDTPSNKLEMKIRKNLNDAILNADIILYLLEKEGAHPIDIESFKTLRKIPKPKIFIINKVDKPLTEEAVALAEYAPYKFSQLLAISCKARWNLGQLNLALDSLLTSARKNLTEKSKIVTNCSNKESHSSDRKFPNNSSDPDLRIALIGKPNAGKSTLFNSLLGVDIALTDASRETTRDPLESSFSYGKHVISLYDTAGLRKIGKMQQISFYAAIRTLRIMEKVDIVWFLVPVDQVSGVSKIDRRIFNFILKARKPLIFLHTKSDLLKTSKEKEEFSLRFSYIFPEYERILRFFISSQRKNGFSTDIWDQTFQLCQQFQKKIPVNTLQKWLSNWKVKQGQSSGADFNLKKIKFLIQVDQEKPVFLCFFQSRNNDSLSLQTRTRLEKSLWQDFYGSGMPIRVFFRRDSK